MIDNNTVEKILEVAEITEVVQDFVSLKKRGVNYIGLCPFHNEKTPSFTVSPAKGIFKCFGCGKGGNSVNFIMEHEHLNYYEALKFLAKKFHIEFEEKEYTKEEAAQIDERESLMIASNYAQKYFSDTLKNHKDGIALGKTYLKERQIREDIVEKFQLGYCLNADDDFTKTAVKNGYKLDYLIKAGLTIKNAQGTFDRFKGRIIFPVHSISGRVIAFGGRVLKTEAKTAKYINSPESSIYHKSNIVYGIYFAKKSIVEKDKCYLVEGYTDVISLHQNGIENVVASSGTSLTNEQIRLIKRFTKNITILYDGDLAGIKASFRGIDLILEEGLNVKVLLFPDNEDPDSFSKKMSSSELIKFINKNEKDFITFKTELLIEESKNDPIKRAMLISDIVKSVAIIPDNIIRSIYLKECSTILKVEEQILYTEVKKIKLDKRQADFKNISRENIVTGKPALPQIPSFVDDIYSESQEREIIEILLNSGSSILKFKDENNNEQNISVAEFIIKEMLNDELELKNVIYKQIFDEFQKQLSEGKIPEAKFFIDHQDDEIRNLATDIMVSNYELSNIYKKSGVYVETKDRSLNKVVPKCLIVYKSKIIKIAEKELREQIKKAQENNLNNEIDELLQKMTILIESKKSLSKITERIFL